jgi:hypothetical protein
MIKLSRFKPQLLLGTATICSIILFYITYAQAPTFKLSSIFFVSSIIFSVYALYKQNLNSGLLFILSLVLYRSIAPFSSSKVEFNFISLATYLPFLLVVFIYLESLLRIKRSFETSKVEKELNMELNKINEDRTLKLRYAFEDLKNLKHTHRHKGNKTILQIKKILVPFLKSILFLAILILSILGTNYILYSYENLRAITVDIGLYIASLLTLSFLLAIYIFKKFSSTLYNSILIDKDEAKFLISEILNKFHKDAESIIEKIREGENKQIPKSLREKDKFLKIKYSLVSSPITLTSAIFIISFVIGLLLALFFSYTIPKHIDKFAILKNAIYASIDYRIEYTEPQTILSRTNEMLIQIENSLRWLLDDSNLDLFGERINNAMRGMNEWLKEMNNLKFLR